MKKNPPQIAAVEPLEPLSLLSRFREVSGIKRFIIIAVGVLMAALFAVMFQFVPDSLSTLILGLMAIIAFLGYLMGMVPLASFMQGFRTGRNNIERATEIQASSTWLSVQQIDQFFRQRKLDQLFAEYIARVEVQSKEGRVVSDLEEVISEESLALRSWQGVVLQIPNTLTSLGLLGTFIGLITGISTIGFSSVEAALSSIEVLLAGIRAAFYTSIVGVIMSIYFNITYKLLWNLLVRELGLFMEHFHLHVMPSVEEQERKWQYRFGTQVLELLGRIPKDRGFSLSNTPMTAAEPTNDQRLMQDIRTGLRAGEFIFHIQPRCNLVTRKVIGGEALLRWESKTLGLVSPAEFLPVVERNGFIVKLDRFIWEEVCKTIRRWIDAGKRPVPLSVNISKTDIMAMDVAAFFQEMTRKYRIPPRALEIEIAQNAYLQNASTIHETEAQLRQAGFRVVVDGVRGDFVAMHTFKDMEADALKLDLRFLDASGKESQTLSAAFEMARKMQFQVLAEGIENAEQFSILRRCGCEEGQGYYLHKPMPVADFEALVDKDRE